MVNTIETPHRMKKLIVLAALILPFLSKAQVEERFDSIVMAGQVVKVIIFGTDTIPVIDIDSVSFTTKRNFASLDERRKYMQLRYYALSVYPYAAEAIRIYRETYDQTDEMRKRKKKRYTKRREAELATQYEKKLKSLTKIQGYILIKMIERELDRPFYDVLLELRGGWQAFKWQQLARFYGFNLNDKYDPNDDPMLEMILSDLKISYQ
jgi:hypothetical protein